MADRDWAKELAKIDQQLQSLPDEALAPAKTGAPTKSAPPAKGGAPQGLISGTPVAGGRGKAATFGMLARLTLSVALGVGMLFWPYEARCGAGLALYLGAVGAVVAGGIWSAVWSWRHRSGRAHSLALLLLLWGLALGSLEILPRVGYAKPTLMHPATWACK